MRNKVNINNLTCQILISIEKGINEDWIVKSEEWRSKKASLRKYFFTIHFYFLLEFRSRIFSEEWIVNSE